MVKPWLIPDIFIYGVPESNDSLATDARPTGPGWKVPVPSDPTQTKPYLIISITNRTEGIPLAEVAVFGNVEYFSIEIWDSDTSTFKPKATKISDIYLNKDFENAQVIKIVLESVKQLNEMYQVWIKIKACFEISGNFLQFVHLSNS